MADRPQLLAEVVRTVDLKPIPTEGGNRLRLRIEVLREAEPPNFHFGRLWRLELRIWSFYQYQPNKRWLGEEVKTDDVILIEETIIDVSGIREQESDQVIAAILEEISRSLGN
jgi:hypothetical protein